MSRPLRVLILEDRPSDAKLMVLELQRAGFAPQWHRSDTEEDFLAQLDDPPEVILADGFMPGYDAIRAIDRMHERGLDIPVIVVTGTLTDEKAVEYMKRGAADYLIKDRLARLGQSVSQAIEHKKLTDERRRMEEERNRFFDLSLDLICVADLHGHFRHVNPSWELTLGWTPDELTERPYVEFVHPDDRASTQREANRLAKFGGNTRGFENRYRGRDGSYRWLSWQAVTDQSRGVIFATARDTTRERMLEDELRQSQKMDAIGRLAGGVAHDFNNLLTVILGYNDIAYESLPPGNAARDLLRMVAKAGEQAAGLTRQLLAFSRKQVINPQLLDLNAVVADAERLFRRLIGADVDLRVEYGPTLPLVLADQGQVEQILLNLIVNARDAMSAGGTLSIRTSLEGQSVVLTVADTGCGMDAATRARVFEPFFTTKGDRGTGLGLSTVYGIVKQFDGDIDIESEPGKGTSFTITFLSTGVRDQMAAGQSGVKQLPVGTETVLLVDDEDGIRSLCQMALAACSFVVLVARNGCEAEMIAESHLSPIHLILTDVILPSESGREIVDRVKTSHPDARVLFMSGYTDDVMIQRGVNLTEVAYLQKPFTPQSLARRVREVLDSPT